MKNLLYPGEELDLEAIANHKDVSDYHIDNYTGLARVVSPCHGIHSPTVLYAMTESSPHFSTSIHYFRERPDMSVSLFRGFHGCGFCNKNPDAHSDFVPMPFIKTRARLALEALRDRLDKWSPK